MSIKHELQSPSNLIVGGLLLTSALLIIAMQMLGIGTPMLSSPSLF